MKIPHLLLGLVLGTSLSLVSQASATSPAGTHSPALTVAVQGGSSIVGHVFNSEHRGVDRVRVQLLDDNNSVIRTVLTDGSGTYTFSRLGDGNYLVRVVTTGTDYIEPATERVSINNFGHIQGGGGGQTVQLDFSLKTAEEAAGGGFRQDVPDAARQAYTEGVKFLEDDKTADQGLANLAKAVELFPNYYQALERLGMEYAKRQRFDEARVVLNKAVEVNPKGEQSWYWLGMSQLKLKKTPDAIETFRKGIKAAPNSANLRLGLGQALYADGKLDEAESQFKQAYKLGGKRLPIVHMHLAQLYDKTKRYKEEASELELYLKEQPDDPNAERIKKAVENLRQKAQ